MDLHLELEALQYALPKHINTSFKDLTYDSTALPAENQTSSSVRFVSSDLSEGKSKHFSKLSAWSARAGEGFREA